MVCYGAGNLAKKGLPILMKRYKIPYIIDCDKKKHGKKLYDIQIIPVNKKTVNCYPVVVMVENATYFLPVSAAPSVPCRL